MNEYKKIFKSAKMRRNILSFLAFVPDKLMLSIQYKIKLGRWPDLINPQRFTEKIQWYKMNYRNPVLKQCVDKYEVREFVKSKGLEDILVQLYAKFDSFEQIDWKVLPNSFVMKTTNGGGGLNVIICPDKTQIDYKKVKEQLACRKYKARTGGREWAYYDIESGIIVEELLVNEENPEVGVNDYKIFCYNGKPKYIIVDVDRYNGHKRNFYDTQWNNLHVTSDCPASDREIPRPENLDDMLMVASKLSEDFPFVRVDLYSIGNKVYFGELTFYPWSGYVQYTPDKYDFEFGKDFNLNIEERYNM